MAALKTLNRTIVGYFFDLQLNPANRRFIDLQQKGARVADQIWNAALFIV
jgi:hypothetical protein